ncbi:hypothetical protein BCV69DRAFT_61261 [Microstroma glucosiphilum]|uniref:Uncharacterized protein n=1 Tax=Pseudomicrostroma glucosiphilum TaxID=1684307 RepID=A0A316U0I8_9BASI|nr:hypothetical protein BCV69DRAFT_61261 [Pseudomicrostroma glucosiphilum]PWN18730.1 hypothetical protein BCV69DRAFT_61261 [Pseudomicrostroma glucosiphilum]
MSRVVLPALDVCNVQRIKALSGALEGSVAGLADISSYHTRQICITIEDPDRRTGKGSTHGFRGRSGRASLYDHLSRLQDFDKEACAPIRYILSKCERLISLRLETTPGVLVTKRNVFAAPMTDERLTPALVDSLQQVKCSLEELTCLLSPWGGAGLEDLFTNLIKSPSPPPNQPWGRLTHLQIHGPAGFRISLPTSSAIGALPSLTHLGLVMPNVVRDAGMGGDVNSPPAALQLLVLLADKLQRLVVIGHTLEGYLGWSALYRAWLRALRLPLKEDEMSVEGERMGRPTLSVQLITAQVRTEAGHAPELVGGVQSPSNQPHPNHFTSWMIARGREGSHWDWSLPSQDAVKRNKAGGADQAWQVDWTVEEWDVPIVEGVALSSTPPSRDADDDGARGRGATGEDELMLTEDMSPPADDVVYGIDNLD